MDLSSGPGEIIHHWKGLFLDQCKDLAASTDQGNFWTYKIAERHCIVKASSLRKELAARSGVMSGVRQCGTPLPSKERVCKK